MRRIHAWIVGLTALALAGCGGMELQKAERLTPGGSGFENTQGPPMVMEVNSIRSQSIL